MQGSQDKITRIMEHINSMYHFINDPELPEKLATSEAMTVLGKINKDFLLYNGIYQVTMPRGLGWSLFKKKHIERCLQTISMTQSYYEPIQYDLDGKEDLLYWRKIIPFRI
jgi:uncharacterized alpha-E superfamily protein